MAELSIIIPTFNEKDNVRPLVSAIESTLEGFSWEIIFVDDDSSDGTLDELKNLARANSNIRFIHRTHQRGLATACIEGMLSSLSPYVAVMDADMQHDEKILPLMLQTLKDKQANIVVGSRHVDGGSMGSMPAARIKISEFASGISHWFVKHKLTDPMSGFFMLERELIEGVAGDLSATGYKLLLDIVVTAGNQAQVVEIPYDMRHRQHGESKLDSLVVLEYLNFLLEKSVGKYIPVKFILFTMVGFSGVFVHLGLLFFFHKVIALPFIYGQILATYCAMNSNFLLNNYITHRDKRLHGKDMIFGAFNFCLACSFGAIINLMVADYLKELDFIWWVAGLSGAVVGSIWNYSMTSVFTWRKK